LFVIDLRRSTEREVLHQQEVDFVTVDIGFGGLAQMALDKRAQAALAGVQGGHLQKMTQLVHQDALIEGVQPGLYLLKKFN